MSDDLSTKLTAEFDGRQAEQGLVKLGATAKRAGRDIEQAGQGAGKAFGNIGAGAEEGGKRAERATKSLIDSIQRTTAVTNAGAKGTADYYSEIARIRGVSQDALKPYLEDLRKAQAAQEKAVDSANKWSAAANGIGGALGKIAASLAGGAFFAKFVAETINAENEQAQLAAVLRSTGEAAGWTQQRLNEMAEAMSSKGGKSIFSPGEINQAQTRMLSYSNVVGQQFPKAMQATIDMAQRMGMSVTQSAETIGKALDVPSEGLSALTKQGFRFTESEKMLVEQFEETGKKAEAQAIILKALESSYGGAAEASRDTLGGALKALKDSFDEVMTGDNGSAQGMRESIESLNKTLSSEATKAGFQAVISGITQVIELAATGISVLGQFGRAASLNSKQSDHLQYERQFDFAKGQLQRAESQLRVMPNNEQLKEDIKTYRETMERAHKEMQRVTAEISNQAGVTAPVIDVPAVVAGTKAVEAQGVAMGKSAEWIRAYGTALEKADLAVKEWKAKYKDAFTSDMEKTIRASFAEKGGTKGVGQQEKAVSGIRARIQAEEELIKRLQDRGAAAQDLSESDKLVGKLQEEIAGTTNKRTKANLEGQLAEALVWQETQKNRTELEKQIKAQEEAEKGYRKYIDSIYKSADAIGDMADQQDAANASFGKSKVAIAELAAEQAKMAAANAKDAGPWTPEHVAALKAVADQHERYVESLRKGEYIAASRKYDDEIQAAKDELQIQQYSMSLLGEEEVKRNKLVATRKSELKLARDLAEIEQLYMGRTDEDSIKRRTDLERKARIKAEEELQVELAQIQNQYAAEQAAKYNDIFRQGFADFANNGMDGLKAFGKSLKTTILTSVADALYKAFAQKYVVNVVASISGLFGGGGAMNTAVQAASGGGMFSNISSGLSGANALGLLGTFGGGMSAGFGGLMGSLGLTTTGTTLGGALSAGSIAMGSGNILGGLGTFLGALGPIVGGLSLLFGGDIFGSLFGRKLKESGVEGDFGGESGFEGRLFKYYKGGLFRSNKTTYEELPEEMRSALGNQFLAMDESIRAMAGAVGLGGEALDGFTARIKVNLKGLSEEEATKKLQEEFQKIADQMGALVLTSEEYTRAGETQLEALTRLSTSITLANEWFKAVGDTLYEVSLAGADMASELMDAFGGSDKFAAATSNYYDKFYSDQEKVANQTRLLNDALKKLGVESMPTSREALREYINGIDLSTEKGRELYAAMIGLADSFDVVYASAENIASLKEDLNVQLLRAQGNDDEATKLERARQLKDLEKYKDPELVRMQVEVWAAEDKTKSEEAAKKAADELAEQLAAALKAAQDLAMKNLEAAVSREKEYWNQFSADAKDSLTKASSYFDLVTNAASTLRGSVEDSASWSAAAGMVYIEQALDRARKGGGLSDLDATKSAIEAATGGLVMGNYATQAELDYDKKVLAGQLDELGGYAALAKTDAQKQIDLANAQIKRLDDTLSYWTEYGKEQIDATLSVTDAIKALEKLMFPEKDAAGAGGPATTSGRGGASFGGGGGSIISGNSSENMFDGYLPDGRPVYKDGSIGTAMDGTAEKIAKGQDPYSNVPGYSGSGKVVYDKEKGMYVPKLNVGTNYLPSDMLVLAHQGERIIPKADNHALMAALGNQGGSAVQMAEVVAELRAVKQELQAIKAGQVEVAYQARKAASVLSSVTDGGLGMRNQPAIA